MRAGKTSALIGVLGILLSACDSRAADSAVIFMYHHVDVGTPESTSVTPDAFAEQLEFLEREGFEVRPLEELLDALASGESVPQRSVAITFDDAYRSVLTEALPRLESRGWPFTVLVNTEAIDEGFGGYLGWDELRTLGERGATIGNHSVTHSHLVRRLEGEAAGDWRRRVGEEISRADARLADEVGPYRIPVFAYPYGEYTTEIKRIVESHGLYGLGQHSGAIGAHSDFLALPRYPVATGLDMTEFALRARSRALPLTFSSPERHIVEEPDGRPALRLAIEPEVPIRLGELACYVTGQGRMPLEWQGDAMRELVTRPANPLRPGRSKVNCTAPSAADPGVYYWWGHLWMRRLPDGRWYDE